MAGRTNYVEEQPGDQFDPVGTPNRIFEHFDPLIGETRATVAALPTSGNWVGRTIFVSDSAVRRQYICTALPGTWTQVLRTVGGVVSTESDADGFITVTHGLGRAPAAVTVTVADDTPAIGNHLKANVRDVGATTFRARFYRSDQNNSPFGSNTIKFYWTAVG